MYLAELFKKQQDKTTVFKTLCSLTLHYPEMSMKYRVGRRSDDPFSESRLIINQSLYNKIKYSNHWRVYFTKLHKDTDYLDFNFKPECLISLDPKLFEIKLAPILSSKDLYVLRQCQNSTQAIRKQVLVPLQEEAWQKMGPAYKTTFCTVGKDMLKAISLVEDRMYELELATFNSVTEFYSQLEKESRASLGMYVDSEGIIQGTIVTIFERIQSLYNNPKTIG